MFEHMEIAESIYEVVVEPSYKKLTRADSNRADCIRQKRGETALSWTHPKKVEISGKRRKIHVDSPTGKSKNCLIHGPGHSSGECKALGDFGTKYTNIRLNKDRGIIPVPRKAFKRQQENNAIDNNAVYAIILTQKRKCHKP